MLAVDREAPAWDERLVPLAGDAGDEAVAAHAADPAGDGTRPIGRVRDAALFRDVWVRSSSARHVGDLISANLDPCRAGCTVALHRFLAAGHGGAIVNVSSHRSVRPVPGCVPYATAKAATEGLTRTPAVGYGPHGLCGTSSGVNAVAPGTVARCHSDLADLGENGPRVARETVMLHGQERIGEPAEVAAAIGHLLSPAASAITGVTLPVDGGRSVPAREP